MNYLSMLFLFVYLHLFLKDIISDLSKKKELRL